MKSIVCAFMMLALTTSALAQQSTIYDEPLSERRIAYDINVSLDPETRTVSGTQRLTWRNPDNVPIDSLQFHLYLNAFKNTESTFMQESGGTHRGFSADQADRWGGMIINSMTVTSGDQPTLSPTYRTPDGDLTDRIVYIQPDDDNVNDQTVIAVPLPRPLEPGETISLDVEFESVLPRIVARTGWQENNDGSRFFMVAQWFPKLGVYEVPGQRYIPADAPRGQWNTHQFHANSEFYADFGTYDVTIEVPEGFVVGATGVRTGESTSNGLHTVTYRADDVHDFAWTTSPIFLEYTDTWRHVNLRLLLQPEHEAQAQRHFDAAKIALEKFDEWVGEYPYTTLTLVDGLGGSNGMEYPTLITCGTTYMMPSWLRSLEIVTIHEFGHQYFYGLLASNEFEEAWLDEGMTSYVETRIVDEVYGPGSVVDLPGLRLADGPGQRTFYAKSNPSRGALFTYSWKYANNSDYGKASYMKPATMMHTLERYLGWETMMQFLQTYYQRGRFKHPTTRDLQDVVEEVSGQDLDWFFDQFVYGTAVVDYAVEDFQVEEAEASTGDAARYESEVRIARREDGVFPQTLRVRFEDGSVEERTWDGASATETFTFTTATPAVEAYLDPDNAIWLDVNRLNNRRIYEPSTLFARKKQFKVIVWAQQLFYLVGSIF